LPLCKERDLRTQIRWGLADFRYRFGREAEAMWLPETACNDRVMSALIDEGLRYVILAPPQAARVRTGSGAGSPREPLAWGAGCDRINGAPPTISGRPKLDEKSWQAIDENTIDTSLSY